MIDAEKAWQHLDELAKPRRSLGKLEALAARLATIQGSLAPVVRPRKLVLFAADHGVVRSGVSAWPSSITALMLKPILMGRAASSALAAANDCGLKVVDVGIANAPLKIEATGRLRVARVGRGTDDLATGAAMSSRQFDAAWLVGEEEAHAALDEGARVLLAGEMGIGNTTPAACLAALLGGVDLELAVGRGAGADDRTLARKRVVVASAVARAAPQLSADPRAAIAAVSGFEIVAMAGFFAVAARKGAVILLDGYVATAAALIAERLHPGTANNMVAAHLSAEPGHAAALAHLRLEPILDMQMRLGEGTGALVALPLLDSAVALLRDVAKLSELGAPRAD